MSEARPSPRVGDFDYESAGWSAYGHRRRTEPRIAARVHAALASARTVINVGAGSGSYEPDDRHVVAVEPSASMRSQRPPHRAPAINARAEQLPFDDDCFDAAMAMVTIHQWSEPETGLRELRRVSRGPVVILTFDGEALDRLWLAGYVPELVAAERQRCPRIERICEVLGGVTTVTAVPIPINCVDGFTEAFYGRPEAFLEPDVRRSQSAWGFVEPEAEERFVASLRADLSSGSWDRSHGALRTQDEFIGALRLVVAT
ncbi:MAG: class I SAM-dependent methyltransferase [Acidimicrobiales bacterium]